MNFYENNKSGILCVWLIPEPAALALDFFRKRVTFRKTKDFPLQRLRERKIMLFSTFSDIYVFCLIEKNIFSFTKWFFSQ